MRRICEQAELRKIGWHTLRHTFASHLAGAGVHLKAIQELLGHSDIKTTLRYAHLSASVLQDAISKLESDKFFYDLRQNNFGQQAVNTGDFSPDFGEKREQDNSKILAKISQKQAVKPV